MNFMHIRLADFLDTNIMTMKTSHVNRNGFLSKPGDFRFCKGSRERKKERKKKKKALKNLGDFADLETVKIFENWKLSLFECLRVICWI